MGAFSGAAFPACGAAAWPAGRRPLYRGDRIPEAAAALLRRYGTRPAPARRRLVGGTVASLLDAGIWARADLTYFIGADAQASARNWVRDAYNLVGVNSPTHVADRYWQGDGAASYLDTGFQPVNHTLRMSQADVTAAVWVVEDQSDAAEVLGHVGSASSSNYRLIIRPRAGSNIAYRANTTNTVSVAWAGSAAGLTAVRRADSVNASLFRDGALVRTDAISAGSLNEYPVSLLRGASAYSVQKLAFAWVGAGLSDQQQADLYSIAGSYLRGVGAIA